MKLKEVSRKKLTEKGLKVFGEKYRYTIFKPREVKGNFIPKWESIPIITGYDKKSEVSEEYISNCPPLSLWFSNNKWQVIHHDWVPGPGPGDFTLEYENEDEAIAFIISYYFSNNSYFQEKKEYVSQNRNGVRIDELEIIFDKALIEIKTWFNDIDEIDFETFSYNKLPNEVWKDHKISSNSQYTMVKFDLGVLRNDIADLKELIYKKRKFTIEDLQKVGSVLTELTILMNKKTVADNG